VDDDGRRSGLLDGPNKPCQCSTMACESSPMALSSVRDLRGTLERMRQILESAFAQDTAHEGDSDPNIPSSGHCGAVAAIVHARLGGELVSAFVEQHSHWFNRFIVGADVYDVDLTGDQFGRPSVQIELMGELYAGARVRKSDEINQETRTRASRLSRRAGLGELDL
jgi:hypothetical protein